MLLDRERITQTCLHKNRCIFKMVHPVQNPVNTNGVSSEETLLPGLASVSHEAHKNFARCLGKFICDSSPWDKKVAKAFSSIGNIYDQMGMLPEALAMYEKDLQITLHMLQPDDLRVADAKKNVGLASCRVGRYSKGLSLLDEALDIQIACLGPLHADVAIALVFAGGHTEALERYQQATSNHKAVSNHFMASLFSRSSTARPVRASLRPNQSDAAIEECGEATEAHVAPPRELGPEHRLDAEPRWSTGAGGVGAGGCDWRGGCPRIFGGQRVYC
jgi:tetratricopeptide (TPR) repeat protein